MVAGAQIEDDQYRAFRTLPVRKVGAREGQARVPASSQVSAIAGQVDSSWGLFRSVRSCADPALT